MRTIHVNVPDDGNCRWSAYDDTMKRVEAYLYSNFDIVDNAMWPDEIVIRGEDVAGWTAEAQMLRLRSGLIAAQVVA